MNAMDIAALATVTRQAYARQQSAYAVMRMALDGVRGQAQGIAQMAQTVDAQKLAQLTGVGQKLDITL